jgi:riboflavin synthase
MFTGIIETFGRVEKIERENSNINFTFSSSISSELKVDQSLSHNGVCLTVVKIIDKNYVVTAIEETLKRTNLGALVLGDMVNLERCMPANGRFDGHIVQGHIDTTAKCIEINNLNGSWVFVFEYEKNKNNITVEKGSVTINGVSLTVVNSEENIFSVCIIPFTFEHTNFNKIQLSSIVNLEFDIIGKYLKKLLNK